MFDQLKNPPSQYRIAPFWVWNETPDLVEIDRQVREMYAKGVGGFFIEGHFAGRVEGSGEALVECTQRACDAAERLGLHVYQYDDPPVPRRISPELSTKLRTSAVHTGGKIRALGRLFTTSSWSLSMAEMKRSIDRQACLGVNFFCPDAFHYSIAGLKPRSVAPSQFYQSTYWRSYKQFADYAARLGYVLSQGTHKPQVAVLRPGGYNDLLTRDQAEWLSAINDCLLAQHVDFDILDENALSKASCGDELLSIEDEHYELVILPPMGSIAASAAGKLNAFADDGGKLIATMQLPAEDSRGDKHAEVRESFAAIFDSQANGDRSVLLDISRPSDLSSALAQALKTRLKQAISVRRDGSECADIACIHRSTAAAELFFLANNSREAREVRVSFRCDGAPHMLNLETGDCTALPNCTQQGNRTVLLYRFEAYGSLTVAFGTEPAFAVAPPIIEGGQEITFSGEWQFSTEQPNCLNLPDWTFNTIIENDRELHEYTTTFDADHIPQDLVLALEQTEGFKTEDGLTILVNDMQTPALGAWIVDVGIRTIDIAGLVKPGRNIIKMTAQREPWTGDPVRVPARARLFGSFSLSERNSLQQPPLMVHNGSWTDQGYPYYSGTAVYRQTIFVPNFAHGQRIILKVLSPADIVEYVINDVVAGIRSWAPYDIDITSLVKPGSNDVELRVTNSLANMILCEARPSGLINGAVAILS